MGAHRNDIISEPSDSLKKVRAKVQACIQCGTCTGSCPNEFAMDATPRRLWRLVLMGREREVFQSRTFTLCSACHYCSLRCPRGLDLADAMAALKQMAYHKGSPVYRKSALFYRSFIQSVRQYGRVREMEFMAVYFYRLKHPGLPLRFAPLGLKLLRKGKVSFQLPLRGQSKLGCLFRKVEEIER
jgi:heterodisulfide reductase subunit C2